MLLASNASAAVAEPSQRELRRGILAMVWPVATENILQLLIGFVNTAMVGRLGAATILAVGLSGRVGMFVWIIFSAIGTGTTVLIARALGAGDPDRVRRIAQQALLVALALMGVVAGIGHSWRSAPGCRRHRDAHGRGCRRHLGLQDPVGLPAKPAFWPWHPRCLVGDQH